VEYVALRGNASCLGHLVREKGRALAGGELVIVFYAARTFMKISIFIINIFLMKIDKNF
jgi:hypothetical protein